MMGKKKPNLAGKKSLIWKYFKPVDEIMATCNFCKQSFSYKSSISNLKQHLQRKHNSSSIQYQITNTDIKPDLESYSPDSPEVESSTPSDQQHKEPPIFSYRGLKRKRTKILRSANVEISRNKNELTSNIKQDLDNKLLDLITLDFQPLAIVEDLGFQEFIKGLNPSYKLPTKEQISWRLLDPKYLEVQQFTRQLLDGIKSVIITTDCWTSNTNDLCIAVSANFINSDFQHKSIVLEVKSYLEEPTSVTLAYELNRIIVHWGLEDAILLAISDITPPIVKNAICDSLAWPHLDCYAQTLDLICSNALAVTPPLLTKLAGIVDYFQKNIDAASHLNSLQKQNNKNIQKLVQWNSARWHSLYYMLQGVRELKQEVKETLDNLAGAEDWTRLTDEDYEIIDELLELLTPMESTTTIINQEENISLSLVLILTNGLADVYQQFQKTSKYSPGTKTILDLILNGITTQFTALINSTTLLITTFLDPRFKHIGLPAGTCAEKAEMAVTNALTELIEKKQQNHVTSDCKDIKSESPELISPWSAFEKNAAKFQSSGGNFKTRAALEVQRYMEEPLLNRNENPLEWWKCNQPNFPNLSELVRLQFGTVATSVPCNRLYSRKGQIMIERRDRLSTEEVKKIMFINMNRSD